MASGLCPNIKHVILHSLKALANQNEDGALCLCSNSASGQQRDPLAGEVVASLLQQLPQQEYLHSANEECPPPRRNSASWCLSQMYITVRFYTTSGVCICHCRRKISNLLILASAIVSYSANNFFLFVGASKKTCGNSGLPLGVPCDIHHGQNSPYHPLCIVGNTFTATRPADLRGAWCVHLVLQTTEGKLAKIANGQKRLATYHTTKAGLQESINVYLSLVSSMTATCLKSQLSLQQSQSFKVAIHNHL